MLAFRWRNCMVFHVKHSSSPPRKKLPRKYDPDLVRGIWARIKEAFYTIDPKMNQAQMAKMISGAGVSINARSLSNYSSGDTLPGLDTMIAISKATGVSLDQLVFGNSNPARDVETLAAAIERWVSSMGFTTQAFVNPRARAIFTRVMKLPEKDLDFIERFLRSTEADHT